MKLYSFGGTALPVDAEKDTLNTEGREALVTLRDGSYDMDGQSIVTKPIKIERNFIVIRPNIDATTDALMQLMGKGRLILKSQMRDEVTYRQTFAKLVKVTRQNVTAGYLQLPMSLSFLIDYPRWMATADEPHYLDNGNVLDDGSTLDAGNKITTGLTTTSMTTVINNTGGMPIRRGRIIFSVRAASSITNPKVYNLTTGEWMLYTGALVANDYLEFNLLGKSALKNWTTNAYANLSIGASQMDWMSLTLGDNSITVSCDAITGTVDWYYFWSKEYL